MLYNSAYFNGSNDIRKYVKIDSNGCITLSDIRRIYNSSNITLIMMLKNHLFCPCCKQAQLFYASYLNTYKGFLKRKPSFQHSPKCNFYNKDHDISHSPQPNPNHKYKEITSKNTDSLLIKALRRAEDSIQPNDTLYPKTKKDKYKHQIHYTHTQKKLTGSKNQIRYPLFSFNHKFNSSDAKSMPKVILYCLAKHIDIKYQPQSYTDKYSGVKKIGYKTVINIITKNHSYRISGVNWKRPWTKDDKTTGPVYNGLISFSVLVKINHYPYKDIDFMDNLNKLPYKINKLS